MADLGYQASDADAAGHSGGVDVVAPGWYKVVIVGSNVKVTKEGSGKLLELKLELQDGTARTITDRLNIVNKSEVAQKIGRGALGKIAAAVGQKGAVTRSEVLHGRPFEVKVSIKDVASTKDATKTFKSNEVDDYRAVNSVPSAASAQGENKQTQGW